MLSLWVPCAFIEITFTLFDLIKFSHSTFFYMLFLEKCLVETILFFLGFEAFEMGFKVINKKRWECVKTRNS